MQITVTGMAMIPLGIFFLLVNSEWLYILMIFFIPFSATVIANIGDSGLQLHMYLGFLLILSFMFKVIVRGYIKIPKFLNMSLVLLMIFGAIVIMSLLMPFIIDGKLLVKSATLFIMEGSFLEFTFHHITQALYLIYGIVITMLVTIRNCQSSRMILSLKVYLLSGMFVSLWGYVQLFLYRFKIPYPYYIFNNSVNLSAQGFTAHYGDLGITRIASVTTEPSIFAQYLLTVIPIIVFAISNKRYIFSPVKDKIILAVVVSILLLSSSAIGYVGFVFLMVASVIISYISNKRINAWYFLCSISLAIIVFAVYYISATIQKFISYELINKMETYSGLERFTSVSNAWNYFLDYPILGIGWGSVTSHDLIVNLLANVGILGFLTFACLVIYVIYCLISVIKIRNKDRYLTEMKLWSGCLCVSLLTILFTNLLTGFAYVFGHFWFILGMSIASQSCVKQCFSGE